MASWKSDRVVNRDFYDCSSFRLPRLPESCTLTDDTTLKLDHFSEDDFKDALEIVRQAAKEGNNVAVDELETVEDLHQFLKLSSNFLLRCPKTNQLRILLVIQTQVFTRTFLTRNPSLVIFGSKEVLHDQIWSDMLQIGQSLITEMDKGYTGCIISVFPTCLDLLSSVRREGFLQVASIPKACRIAGLKGLREYYVFYKHLGGEPMKIPTLDEMSRIEDDMMCEGDEALRTSEIRGVPFLPVHHTTSRGHRLFIRSLELRDIEEIHSLFVRVAKMGRGYGIDELLSLQFFKEQYLLSNYSMVVELEGQGIIACVVICESNFPGYARSKNTGLYDVICVIKPEHFGKGIGGELFGVSRGMAKDLGFTGCLSDTMFNNEIALNTYRSEGMMIVGCIPNGVYLGEGQFEDVTLAYSDITKSPSFSRDLCNDPGKNPSKL